MYALAETHVVCVKNSLSVLKLSGNSYTFQVLYTLVKGYIFSFICLYTLRAAAVHYKSSPKKILPTAL